MKAEDFAGGGAENPYCSFHASYLRKGERKLKLLEKKSGKGCCCTTSDDSRQYVENQWSYSTKTYDEGEMTQTDALDEFLNRVHNETFAVSGMLFQDAWNLELDRLKRCYICEVDSEYGMVPFCAYNLTNSKGTYLYRNVKRTIIDEMICKQEGIAEVTREALNKIQLAKLNAVRKEKKNERDFTGICRKNWKIWML